MLPFLFAYLNLMPLAKVEKIENTPNNIPFELSENETVHFTQANVFMYITLEKPEGKV